MMRETLYLDTSVISAYYDERVKERQAATIRFWNDVLPRYKCVISEITLDELESTGDKKRKELFMGLVERFPVLKINNKVENLANAYVTRGVFPARYLDDARHVAVATHHGISYVVSWNFEHLVKVKTRKTVNLINVIEGYREIEIVSPQEL
jgi:predicted nucleic acid-binding protein